MVRVPVAGPACVGMKFTVEVKESPGWSVMGKKGRSVTVKLAPTALKELITVGAVPVFCT